MTCHPQFAGHPRLETAMLFDIATLKDDTSAAAVTVVVATAIAAAAAATVAVAS